MSHMWAAPAHLLFKNGNKVAVIQRILYIYRVLSTYGNSYAKVEKWILCGSQEIVASLISF